MARETTWAALDEGYKLARPLESFHGTDLRVVFQAATRWLKGNASYINALNVYPVPDGDTGTNMLLTMQAACHEAASYSGNSAAEVLGALARGALMGARGNSGVILSQFLRGMAYALEGKETFNASDFSWALCQGAVAAYQGVTEPVEGTILTVAREVSEAVASAIKESSDFHHIFEEIVAEAKASVARTPLLLPELERAGVVDAGGQGLSVIFEGILRFMQGEPLEPEFVYEQAPQTLSLQPGGEYGYDTQFLIEGEGLKLEEIRARITSLGDSVIVVGDERLIKVHVHTQYPGEVLEYGLTQGTLRDITVENLQEQYEEFLAASARPPIAAEEVSDIGIVAVVPGPGLKRIFESLGTSLVVSGGQTMNPSTAELLEAIESISAENVLVLPNNKNVILTARQSETLSSKNVIIVPTRTVPQGVSALFAFNYQADLASNANAMALAAQSIQTGEITTSVRDAVVDGVRITKGEIIGLVNGRLIAHGTDSEVLVYEVLRQMKTDQYEIITIYYGDGVEQARAEMLLREIRQRYPEQEIELINGGQPYYHYILSAE